MNKLKVYKFIEKKIYDTFALYWMPGWGRHKLVVSEHLGFGSDPLIGSDRRRRRTKLVVSDHPGFGSDLPLGVGSEKGRYKLVVSKPRFRRFWKSLGLGDSRIEYI